MASYPRSGNTWFRMILSSILADGEAPDINHPAVNQMANSRTLFDELTGLPSSDLSSSEILNLRPATFRRFSDFTQGMNYLKTHDQFRFTLQKEQLFPLSHSFGCIYLIRNPLDVAVSSSFFFGKTVDEIIGEMLDPIHTLNPSIGNLIPVLEELTGNWSDHVMSWIHSGMPVHIIRYEDLLDNTLGTIQKVLDFLQISVSEETLKKAIASTAFHQLKKAEETHGFKEKRGGAETFFRKGISGEGIESLTKDQIRQIVTHHGAVMEHFGYRQAELEDFFVKRGEIG